MKFIFKKHFIFATNTILGNISVVIWLTTKAKRQKNGTKTFGIKQGENFVLGHI